MMFLAQTPILNAPTGSELLTWLECSLAVMGIVASCLGAIVLWKQAFGRKPTVDDDFEDLNARLIVVEKTIALLATKDDVNAKIDAKFSELNGQRRQDISALHKDVEHASRQIAGVQAQMESQVSKLGNIDMKLDRWIEGELAATRRELSEAKKK